MDYMSLVHELIVSMSTTFMVCIVAFLVAPVAIIVSYQINTRAKRRLELEIVQAHHVHEISKLEQQRKMIDTRVIEGTHRRLGEEVKSSS